MNWTADDSQWEDYKVCVGSRVVYSQLKISVEVSRPTTLSCQATKVCLKQMKVRAGESGGQILA